MIAAGGRGPDGAGTASAKRVGCDDARPAEPDRIGPPAASCWPPLRPQVFATGSPWKVPDPIIEPLWTGVRALAAVDHSGASLIDAEGDPVPHTGPILEALAAGVQADGIVVDGFVTKQAGPVGPSAYVLPAELPSMSTMFGLRRNRAVDTVKLKEDALAAVTFAADDEVRLIVTDLLWLDDTSLLDVPLLERRRRRPLDTCHRTERPLAHAPCTHPCWLYGE